MIKPVRICNREKKDTSPLIHEWRKIKYLKPDGKTTQFQYIFILLSMKISLFLLKQSEKPNFTNIEFRSQPTRNQKRLEFAQSVV
ncbi:hypothetical protein ACX27_11050 [Nostoc piscinale CENA21]|uniref:Uncharacterized protein n=1 Tax=Nostoc piscinale CENA21 TaxID=224013 RepID=A0A0M4TUG2_9NOSO|nr:hypothetical protein ACX27_11050 [Nostoc piscinale CENA21]